MNIFKIDLTPSYPDGFGLSQLLISPFMVWHPFFTRGDKLEKELENS